MPSRYAKCKTQRAEKQMVDASEAAAKSTGNKMADSSETAATGAGQKLYLEVFLNLPLQSSFFYSV